MRRAITAWRSARSASLLVGGRLGSWTKATTASQSLRISPASSRTLFSTSCRLYWQFHWMRAISRLTAGVSSPLAAVDPLDQAAKIAHEIAAEAGAGVIIALGERQAVADQMRQAALAAGMIAVGAVAVGDPPAQEGLADQRGQLLL